jgi:hypothetical protein
VAGQRATTTANTVLSFYGPVALSRLYLDVRASFESRKWQLTGEVIVGGSCSMNMQCLAIGHSRVMEGQWCYQLYHSTQLVDTVRGTLGRAGLLRLRDTTDFTLTKLCS